MQLKPFKLQIKLHRAFCVRIQMSYFGSALIWNTFRCWTVAWGSLSLPHSQTHTLTCSQTAQRPYPHILYFVKCMHDRINICIFIKTCETAAKVWFIDLTNRVGPEEKKTEHAVWLQNWHITSHWLQLQITAFTRWSLNRLDGCVYKSNQSVLK